MLALLLLAVALGLDNLAAAIGFGVGDTGRVSGGTRVRIAVVFGAAARWLGGGALIACGVAGLVQARRDSGERTSPPQRTGRLLLTGLVLSGDNLAAGFALGAYHVGIVVAAVVFGVVSVAMSLTGLELGARIGAAAGERSTLIASALLIVVGAVIAAGVL